MSQQSTTKIRASTIGVILIGLVVASGVWYYMKQHIVEISPQPIMQNTPGNTSGNTQDPTCDGTADPRYDLGYGVEHIFTGTISPGKQVTIIESCDQKTFTITGAVNQTIRVGDLPKAATVRHLTDMSSGTEVVDLDNDFNHDGYKDLKSIVSNGQGVDGIKTYLIFLYDPTQNIFVYNREVSSPAQTY